jgi:hypothetical protein
MDGSPRQPRTDRSTPDVLLTEPVKNYSHRLSPKLLLQILPFNAVRRISFQLGVPAKRFGYAFIFIRKNDGKCLQEVGCKNGALRVRQTHRFLLEFLQPGQAANLPVRHQNASDYLPASGFDELPLNINEIIGGLAVPSDADSINLRPCFDQ